MQKVNNVSYAPFQLIPEYRDYLWGGGRLRPGQLTAEAWVIYEHDRIAGGRWAGLTPAKAARDDPVGILGNGAMRRSGARFPLLIKLLDCVQWLSLQVHPDDAWAARLAGDGQFGKTEAWHILEAAPGAQIVAGMQPGVAARQLAAVIGQKELLDLVRFQPVQTGDTILMPAGTIHALGPGLFVYEVQQTSDLTYRVYDWDRPQTGGRVLHIEQARLVSDPVASAFVCPLGAETRQSIAASPYFSLEHLRLDGVVGMDTAGQSFHALTVIAGGATVEGGGERLTLGTLQSAVVPAGAGEYWIEGQAGSRLLLASVPGDATNS